MFYNRDMFNCNKFFKINKQYHYVMTDAVKLEMAEHHVIRKGDL